MSIAQWLRHRLKACLNMSSNNVFNWNGEVIHFNDWKDHGLGTYNYLTKDRRFAFTFELKQVGSNIRIYIREQPGYGTRATDGHSTHRLSDNGKPYICIRGDLQPTNVPDALSWLVYWAEETGKYIKTGQSFS
jgi:hypothetical protein